MSLKREYRMLRMNDNPHEEFRAAELSRDEGICDDQPPRGLVSSGGRGGLRAHRAGTAGASLPRAEQRAKRNREKVPGQGHGLEPRASDTVDPAVDRDVPHREEASAASKFPAAVYAQRYRHAGRGGCRSRGPVGPGGAALVSAGMGSICGEELPAASGDFGVAHLQSAEVGGIPKDSREGAAHAGAPGFDRGTTPAGPEGASRLSARGHGASGAARWAAGRVSHQRGGHGDAMASS